MLQPRTEVDWGGWLSIAIVRYSFRTPGPRGMKSYGAHRCSATFRFLCLTRAAICTATSDGDIGAQTGYSYGPYIQYRCVFSNAYKTRPYHGSAVPDLTPPLSQSVDSSARCARCSQSNWVPLERYVPTCRSIVEVVVVAVDVLGIIIYTVPVWY